MVLALEDHATDLGCVILFTSTGLGKRLDDSKGSMERDRNVLVEEVAKKQGK